MEAKTNNDLGENLLIHASVAGSLMVDKKGYVITQNELQELSGLEFKENQAKMGQLPPRQRWTETMIKRKEELTEKKNRPFELSDTAKGMIDDVWLNNVKGIPNLVTSKYMEKGLWMEEEAISLLTEIDGFFYEKNKERKFDDMFTGECDIINAIPGVGKVIQDVKCSWSVKTFMEAAELTLLREWQGRVYLELYDADEFWLRPCLMDAPSHILEGERYRFAIKHGIIDHEEPEAAKLLEAFERTMVFSDNPNICIRERAKKVVIKRDKKLFQEIRKRVPAAREYYKNLTL